MPDAGTMGTTVAPKSETGIRLAGLDHVVLRVADLDRAIEFYEKVLNCRVERRLEQPKLVQLRAGASLIDLVPAAAAAGAAADAAGRNMDHFAVRVDGFDAAALAAHLRRHGVEVGEVRERYG
ncbi:MAG: VOC family protein, partial [Stellaceae bacterium]